MLFVDNFCTLIDKKMISVFILNNYNKLTYA